jgi:hypothetical protein
VPCLHLPVLDADPGSPEVGELWCVDDGASDQHCCFQAVSGAVCWNAVETP